MNPVAIAEEAASLDVITDGRFIFGIGLGYREEEDNAFGLGPGERVPKLRAHLDVIKKLWAGEPVDYESSYCRLKGATMALRPVQQPIRRSGWPRTTIGRWSGRRRSATPG